MIGLGASNTMGIGLALYLDDQLTSKARQVTQTLSTLGADVDKVVESFNRIDQTGQAMQNIGKGIIRTMIPAVKSFAQFEDIMNSVRVIAGDQGLTDIDYSKMITQVKSLGEQYGILPQDIATAQLELAKAGIKPAEIMKMTEATMALGAATDTVVAGAGGAAEMLVNVMQAFNATADEADRFASVMTSAANESTIDVTDFYQSMRYTADIARSLSIPIEDTAAAIATLGNAGLKGSIAGTSLANMYRYLAKAVGQFGLQRQKEALDMLGIKESDILTAEGSLKSMAEILALFRKQYEGMTDVQRLAATQGLFGVRGDRAAQPLIRALRMDTRGLDGKLMPAYEDMLEKIQKGVGVNVHIEQAQKRLDDLKGDWSKLVAAFERFKITVGGALGPTLRPLIRAIQQGVMSLTDLFESPVGKFLVKIFSGSGIWLIVLGKMVSTAAQFYKYLFTAGTSLLTAFRDGKAAAAYMNQQLLAGSLAFLKNIKAASAAWLQAVAASRGITTHVQGGAPVIVSRDTTPGSKGQFTGGKAPRHWLSWILGTLFKKDGLKLANSILKFFKPVGAFFGKLAGYFGPFLKGLSWASKFFGFLWKGIAWLVPKLFSWQVVVADLVATLLFGKGIFEMLWDAIVGFVGWIKRLFGGNDEGKKQSQLPGEVSAAMALQGPMALLNPMNWRGASTPKMTGDQTEGKFKYFMNKRTAQEKQYIESLLKDKTPGQQTEFKKTLIGLTPAELKRFRDKVQALPQEKTGVDAFTQEQLETIRRNMRSMSETGNIKGAEDKQASVIQAPPTTINLTIHPQADRVTKQQIEVDPSRKINSFAIG